MIARLNENLDGIDKNLPSTNLRALLFPEFQLFLALTWKVGGTRTRTSPPWLGVMLTAVG